MYSAESGKYYHSNPQLCNMAWYDLPAPVVIISLQILLSRQSHLVTNLGTTALQPWACQELRLTPIQALWPSPTPWPWQKPILRTQRPSPIPPPTPWSSSTFSPYRQPWSPPPCTLESTPLSSGVGFSEPPDTKYLMESPQKGSVFQKLYFKFLSRRF